MKSIVTLRSELKDRQITTRRRIGRSGRAYGGKPFSRGSLYIMIQNELYVGKVLFKGLTYQGKQEAIVPLDLWNRVQAVLKENRQQRTHTRNTGSGGLLTGLLFGPDGSAFFSVYTSKGSRRYQYYVSKDLRSRSEDRPFRVSAHALEKIVRDEIAERLRDKAFVVARFADRSALDLSTSELIQGAERLAAIIETADAPTFRGLVERVVLDRRSMRICLHGKRVMDEIYGHENSEIEVVESIEFEIRKNLRLKRSGSGNSIVIIKPPGDGRAIPDKHLVKAIAKGHLLYGKMLSGEFGSIAELAKSESIDRRYMSRVLQLAFLSPRIVDAICNGSEPEDLTTEALLKAKDFPMDWQEQERIWGFGTS